MAMIFEQESRTFSEYLLVPNLTTRDNTPENVDLSTAIVRYRKGEEKSRLSINIPLVSAVMQAVSDDGMAIALSRSGGLSFIYASQSVESQAEMVSKVKKYKAGFVTSDSNVTPDATLADVLAIKARTGHSTIAVTADGTANGRLLGIVTSRDYRISRTLPGTPVRSFMTPFDHLVYAREGINLSEANDIIWEHKINQLPIVNDKDELVGMVFRKDYDEHKDNPEELLDAHKRLIVGAGINTRDYETRVPALIASGADILCIDSSDGFTQWQQETLAWIRAQYGDDVLVGAGNVVDAEGFRYLAGAGADFVKVGIGGGSICITREQKGIGCGQASAVMAVAAARDQWYKETGVYVPICSDGGIVYDYHMSLALAMGADFIMLGRYFARFDESPTRRLLVNGTYVPYAGKLKDNLDVTTAKLRATMCACGANDIETFQEKARLVVVSSTSIVEGGAHDVIQKESERRP
jgi:IMP dehydrogenase